MSWWCCCWHWCSLNLCSMNVQIRLNCIKTISSKKKIKMVLFKVADELTQSELVLGVGSGVRLFYFWHLNYCHFIIVTLLLSYYYHISVTLWDTSWQSWDHRLDSVSLSFLLSVFGFDTQNVDSDLRYLRYLKYLYAKYDPEVFEIFKIFECKTWIAIGGYC